MDIPYDEMVPYQETMLEIDDDDDEGLAVVLIDGSRWLVDPAECTVVILWMPASAIRVAESPSGSWMPYELTNLDTGESALAILAPKNREDD
jgi:hypothetical protein